MKSIHRKSHYYFEYFSKRKHKKVCKSLILFSQTMQKLLFLTKKTIFHLLSFIDIHIFAV
jgi:hypothetical protein